MDEMKVECSACGNIFIYNEEDPYCPECGSNQLVEYEEDLTFIY